MLPKIDQPDFGNKIPNVMVYSVHCTAYTVQLDF